MRKSVLDHEVDAVQSRSDTAKAVHLNHRSGVTQNYGFAVRRLRPKPLALPVCSLEGATTAKGIGAADECTTNPGAMAQGIRPASGLVDLYRMRDAACRLYPVRVSSRTGCNSHSCDRDCGLKYSTRYRTDWGNAEAKLQCRYACCPIHRYRACSTAVLGGGDRDSNALWRQGTGGVRRAAGLFGVGRTRETHATDRSPPGPGRLYLRRRHGVHCGARSSDAVSS